MRLVRDLLDNRMVDRHGRPLGRVDGLVLEQRDGAPPRVVCFESGLVTLARRLHPRLARWTRDLELWLGIAEGDPVRFPIRALRAVGADVRLDVAAGETDARRWEKWLRKHVVGRIPGSGARRWRSGWSCSSDASCARGTGAGSDASRRSLPSAKAMRSW